MNRILGRVLLALTGGRFPLYLPVGTGRPLVTKHIGSISALKRAEGQFVMPGGLWECLGDRIEGLRVPHSLFAPYHNTRTVLSPITNCLHCLLSLPLLRGHIPSDWVCPAVGMWPL